MKNLYLLFFLFLVGCLPLRGQQNWFGNDPNWTNFFNVGFGGYGYEYMTVGNDTVVQGQLAKNLRSFYDYTVVTDQIRNRPAYQSGDTIWVWNHVQSRFYIQYDFSLTSGGVVEMPAEWGGENFQYVIDSIGIITINGQTLRFQNVHWLDYPYGDYPCQGLIIETIGFVSGGCNGPGGFFYPELVHFFVDRQIQPPTEGPGWQLCHYHNDLIDYGSTNDYCDLSSDSYEPMSAKADFSLQPNPFHISFSLISLNGLTPTLLRLFDTAGRLLLQVNQPAGEMDATALPPGLYVVEIIAADGSRHYRQAVKW